MNILFFIVILILLYFFYKLKYKFDFEYVFSKTPNFGILVFDKYGNINFINKKFEEIFFLESKFYLKKNIKYLCSKNKYLSFLEKFLDQKNSFIDVIHEVILLDSKYYRFSISSILEGGKNFEGCIVSCVDISYEKKIEEEKIKHESISTVNSKMAHLGQISSMITHQQKSPLSSAMLCLEEIENLVANKSINNIDFFIKNARGSLVFMNETIDTFSKFYKNDNTMSLIDLKLLLNDVIFVLNYELSTSGIEIVFDYNDKKDYFLNTYGGYLRQVILDLILNSKYELSKILKSDSSFSPKIKLYLYDDCKNFYIEVNDNGNGILSDKVFEQFYTTKDKDGTGLGLYISKILASNYLNSRLYIKSKSNPTIFCLELKKN